jgi:hypothetical protein
MDGDGEGSKLGKVKGFFGRLGRKRDDRNASADDVSNVSVRMSVRNMRKTELIPRYTLLPPRQVSPGETTAPQASLDRSTILA